MGSNINGDVLINRLNEIVQTANLLYTRASACVLVAAITSGRVPKPRPNTEKRLLENWERIRLPIRRFLGLYRWRYVNAATFMRSCYRALISQPFAAVNRSGAPPLDVDGPREGPDQLPRLGQP